MKLRPLNDVLVIKHDPIVKHDGAIVLCDRNSEEKMSPYATLISWGPHCKYKEYYKVGARIKVPSVNALDHEDPQKVKIDGEEYRLIREHKVHAIIE